MYYLLALAIAPVFFLLSYVKKKDPNPEPKELLRKIFILGCVSVIPAIALEMAFGALFIGEKEVESFFDVFFGIALIEEFVKWIVIYIICFRSKHFDETYDAIVYAAYSALAFACIENIGYVLLDEDGAGLFVGIIRAFTAVPGHLFDGVIMGYYFAKARSAKAQNKGTFGLLFCSLIIPSVIHAIYDYLLGFGEVGPFLIWVVFFIGLAIFCVSLIKKSAQNNVAISDAITIVTQPTPQPATQSQPIRPSAQQPVEQAVTPQTTQISYDWGDSTQATSTQQPATQNTSQTPDNPNISQPQN